MSKEPVGITDIRDIDFFLDMKASSTKYVDKYFVIYDLLVPEEEKNIIPFTELSFYKANTWEYFNINEYWMYELNLDVTYFTNEKYFESYLDDAFSTLKILESSYHHIKHNLEESEVLDNRSINEIIQLVSRIEKILKIIICITENMVGVPSMTSTIPLYVLKDFANKDKPISNVYMAGYTDNDKKYTDNVDELGNLKRYANDIWVTIDRFGYFRVTDPYLPKLKIKQLLAGIIGVVKLLIPLIKGDTAKIYRELLKLVKLIEDRISKKFDFNYC